MRYVLKVILLTFLCVFGASAQVAITARPGNFRHWNYTPAAVFGIGRLTSVANRNYWKIWKTDPNTVKLQEINPAGIVIQTETFRFSKGVVAQDSTTNRWGNTYAIAKYSPVGVGQLSVTRSNSGENPLFPAITARYIFKNSQIAEIRYLSFDGKPVNNENGVAITRYKRYTDPLRYSLIREMEFFDENGQPAVARNLDAHRIVYERDERGNITSTSYYGADGEPSVNRFGGFRETDVFDADDNLVSSTAIGVNDEPVNNSFGFSRVRYEYKNGLASKMVRYDAQNKVVRSSSALDGVAIATYEYDDQGNEMKRKFFDVTEKPLNSTAGYQSINRTFNPAGQLVAEEYFDGEGQPAKDRSGIHRYEYERDEVGRIIQQAYFDTHNSPMKDADNQVFMVKYKYDEAGRQYSESYWKNASTKMSRWDGFHESITRYNADGLPIEDLKYDENGSLFVGKSGFSRVTSTFDAMGRTSELKYFNDQVPALLENTFVSGFHSIRYSYDSSGRTSTVRYFDAHGNPVNAEAFVMGKKNLFDHFEIVYRGNRVVEERLFKLGSDIPVLVIDCLKNDFIGPNGTGIGRKNQ